MKLRFAVPLALLLSSTAMAPAMAQPGSQPVVSEAAQQRSTVQGQALPIVEIAYEKVVMPNGLTLIVHEDHRAPVVSVATYYHVGSANETPGRTGFAHLFEHLVFNGSENANDDWFKLMNEIGATGMNGSTGNDRTNYYQTVSKGALDRVLWYESDRMGNLLPAVDEAKVDEQRKVVQNEKRQRANDPLGALPDMLYAATYPESHPYSWTPIGSMEDLDAASLDDVKSFFNTWYGAGNAVLVLSGDITLAEAREKVQKYYGHIPAGPAIERSSEQPAIMTENTRGKLEASVANPQLIRAWNVPSWSSRDVQLLELAASALSSGEHSLLQKHLVRERELASDVEVQVNALELGSQIHLSATARPGVSLAQLEAAIDEELAEFLRDGVSLEDLNRIKFDSYASSVRGQTSTMAKARSLAEGELYAGDPGFNRTWQEIVNASTPASVTQTARKWLSKGSYTVEIIPLPEYKISDSEVDRTTKPPIGKADAFTLPPLQHATLSNGIKVMLAERHDVPTIGMSMMFDVGSLPDRDLASVGQSTALGLAVLGTRTRSALEISARMEELGASVYWTTDNEMSRFNMNALKLKLDETLDLYADVLLNPTFPKDEWNRKFDLFKASFEENKKLPQGKTALIYSKLLYGADHPYSEVVTPEIAEKLTVDDFRGFYSKWIRPDLATILIVGDTNLAEIMPKLEKRLADWKATGPAPVKPPLPDATIPDKPRVVLVNQPNAESSIISVVQTGPARNNPDYDVLSVANMVMGGDFVARLNMNLREEKGWSYGAMSQISDSPLIGQIGSGAVVQTDKSAESLSEIDREIRELATTRRPSAAEIEVAKNSMLLGMVAGLQDPGGALKFYRDAYRFDLPENYWNNYVPNILALTTEQVDAAATRLYDPAQLTWFVVGDLSKIEAKIRKLNLGEVMVYDADGKRVR